MAEIETIKAAIGLYTIVVFALAAYLAASFKRRMTKAAEDQHSTASRLEKVVTDTVASIERAIADLREQAAQAAMRAETANADAWQAIDVLRRQLDALQVEARNAERLSAQRREDLLREISDLKVLLARHALLPGPAAPVATGA